MLDVYRDFLELLRLGGWVMWPLLAMALVAVMLIVERAWYWWRVNRRATVKRLMAMQEALVSGNVQEASTLARHDDTVYGRIVERLLKHPASDAAVAGAVEAERPKLERFMPLLSTIITAAPMLGILGTVTGIIQSFNEFSSLAEQQQSDLLEAVSGGIAQALWSTAAGLLVAIVVLFPYNAFRSQMDRTLGRIEALAAAAGERTAGAALPNSTSSGAASSATAKTLK